MSFLSNTLNLVIICALFCLVSKGQVTELEKKELSKNYLNEVNKYYNSYRNAVKNEGFSGAWAGAGMIYRTESGGEFTYMRLDAKTGSQTIAFKHNKMAAELGKVAGKKLDAKKLSTLEMGDFEGQLKIKHLNKWYLWKNEKLERIIPSPITRKSPHSSSTSPDEKWKIRYVENNIVLVNLADQSEKKITDDAGEEFFYNGARWSPDSKKFMFQRIERGQEGTINVIRHNSKGDLEVIKHPMRYDRPGDKINQIYPMIGYTDGSPVMKVEAEILKNHYRISHFKWRSKDELTFHGVERGFGKYHVVLVNARTRNSHTMIAEESDTYVDWNNTTRNYRELVLPKKEIIWHSERDGYGHLYLYDGISVKAKNQITKGDFVVKDIVHVDEEKRRILFTAGGEVDGLDPYYIQYYWVNFDGSGMIRITDSKKNHELKFSADYAYAVDISSTPAEAPNYDVINAQTGEQVKNIGSYDLTRLMKTNWQPVEPFMSKDRDGKFEVWGSIYRPANFDPKKKYPVIELIYAGPHGHYVKKDFNFWTRNTGEMTAMGFIVVRIDGRGTNGRSREFSHFAYKNLIDSGFPDRIAWIKAAAAKYPQMDLTRVGIFGGSAGGQSSTAALLMHGEFYKAAVSDCGCHDNRMDKIWWNEQWMDYPVGPHYEDQSNATHAHKLNGALMLTVGEVDRNVDPASTVELAMALTKANKKFDLHTVPRTGHGAGEKVYMRYLRAAFFKKHLGDPVDLQ